MESDVFYLGMNEYSWEDIPDPEGEMPIDPMSTWCMADRYDWPCGWQNDQSRYENELLAWKKRQLEIIYSMNEKELKTWKVNILNDMHYKSKGSTTLKATSRNYRRRLKS